MLSTKFWVFACVPNTGRQSIWRQCPPSARKQSTKKLPNRPAFTHVQGGHPQREGANLGAFVPVWLVILPAQIRVGLELAGVSCRIHGALWDRNPQCTKIARFSAVAAAICTAPGKIARLFEAPRCAISCAKKVASEPRFLLR